MTLGEGMEDIFRLCDVVRETAFDIHRYLRSGHFEKVYENALAHRLRSKGLKVDPQHQLLVRDEDGTVLGHYVADLLIEGVLLVEVKASVTLGSADTAQILGYLRASGLRHGLPVNFGAQRLQIQKFIV